MDLRANSGSGAIFTETEGRVVFKNISLNLELRQIVEFSNLKSVFETCYLR